MDHITTEKWSSLEEIAEHLGVSKDTAYSGTSGRRIRRHPDRCTGIIRTAFPVVSGHLVEYVF